MPSNQASQSHDQIHLSEALRPECRTQNLSSGATILQKEPGLRMNANMTIAVSSPVVAGQRQKHLNADCSATGFTRCSTLSFSEPVLAPQTLNPIRILHCTRDGSTPQKLKPSMLLEEHDDTPVGLSFSYGGMMLWDLGIAGIRPGPWASRRIPFLNPIKPKPTTL